MDQSDYDLYPSRPESSLPNVYGTYPGKPNQTQRLKGSSVSTAEANGEFPLLMASSQQNMLEASQMDWPSSGLPPTPVKNGRLLHKKPKNDFYSTGTPIRQNRFGKARNGTYGFSNGGLKSDYSHVNLEANRSSRKSKSRQLIHFCKYTSKALLTELVVVSLCTFFHFHMHSQLLNQFNKATQKLILSATDACLVAVLLNAFQRIHFNPVVSVAHLFSMTTPWYLCLSLMFMQFFGSFLATFVFVMLHESEKVQEIDQELSFILNGTITWNAYKLMLNQFLGLILVVVSHLNYSRRGSSVFTVGFAVFLSSFLSLQGTVISWNSPVEIFAYFVQKALLAAAFPLLLSPNNYLQFAPDWRNQYILWLGPVLGALVGCILSRLTTSKKVINKERTVKPRLCIARKAANK